MKRMLLNQQRLLHNNLFPPALFQLRLRCNCPHLSTARTCTQFSASLRHNFSKPTQGWVYTTSESCDDYSLMFMFIVSLYDCGLPNILHLYRHYSSLPR